MARVEYSAEINELKGSIAGTTFQRNKSGTIAKSKPSLVFNPTSKQVVTQQLFNVISKNWASVSFANKLLWAAFAAANQKYNYWNVQKNLSGFNWYLSINTNRYLCGQGYISAPPVYTAPLSCPTFQAYLLSDELSIYFDTFVEKDFYYLFIYATPPIRSINLQSRKSLRLIKVVSPNPILWEDVTAAYENYFGITLPAASSSEAYNILIAISCVSVNTFISGQFFLSNTSLDLSTNVNLIGSSLNDQGQQAGQSYINSIENVGGGVVVAGTGSTGHVLRSTDYGQNWSDLGQVLSKTHIQSLSNCGNGVVISAASASGYIIRSTDYGQNWSNQFTIGSETVGWSSCYLGNGVCLFGTGNNGHIARSIDYGVNWSDLGQQYSQTRIYGFISLGNGIVLAGTGTGGLMLRSTDYGATWSNLGQLGSETLIRGLIYLGNGICLAGTGNNGHIFRSIDYGVNWSDLGQQFSQTQVLSFAYFGFGVVLAGTLSGGLLLRSTDYGATWSNLGQTLTESGVVSMASLYTLSLLVGTYSNAHILNEGL